MQVTESIKKMCCEPSCKKYASSQLAVYTSYNWHFFQCTPISTISPLFPQKLHRSSLNFQFQPIREPLANTELWIAPVKYRANKLNTKWQIRLKSSTCRNEEAVLFYDDCFHANMEAYLCYCALMWPQHKQAFTYFTLIVAKHINEVINGKKWNCGAFWSWFLQLCCYTILLQQNDALVFSTCEFFVFASTICVHLHKNYCSNYHETWKKDKAKVESLNIAWDL